MSTGICRPLLAPLPVDKFFLFFWGFFFSTHDLASNFFGLSPPLAWSLFKLSFLQSQGRRPNRADGPLSALSSFHSPLLCFPIFFPCPQNLPSAMSSRRLSSPSDLYVLHDSFSHHFFAPVLFFPPVVPFFFFFLFCRIWPPSTGIPGTWYFFPKTDRLTFNPFFLIGFFLSYRHDDHPSVPAFSISKRSSGARFPPPASDFLTFFSTDWDFFFFGPPPHPFPLRWRLKT